MVVNVSGRFHMDKGVTARFGDDILERVKQGPIEMTAKAEGGRTFQWHLTKQVRHLAAPALAVLRSFGCSASSCKSAILRILDRACW